MRQGTNRSPDPVSGSSFLIPSSYVSSVLSLLCVLTERQRCASGNSSADPLSDKLANSTSTTRTPASCVDQRDARNRESLNHSVRVPLSVECRRALSVTPRAVLNCMDVLGSGFVAGWFRMERGGEESSTIVSSCRKGTGVTFSILTEGKELCGRSSSGILTWQVYRGKSK